MRVKFIVNLKRANIMIAVLLLSYVILSAQMCNAAVYLDGSTTGCSNGSTTYNPANRTCGSGSDKVYLDLANFSSNIVAGTTNYMRAGNYYRTVNSWQIGALDITTSKAGSSGNPTIVKAYTGEERQVVIATASNKFQYNPNPGDTSGTNSVAYYPNPAVAVHGNYITVDGVKTYGQVFIQDYVGSTTIHDSGVQNSDLGGGGPNNYQGQVVFISNAYNILVKNNKIHNSCWGESDENGAAVMGYAYSATVENNDFYDNWGVNYRHKDAGSMGSYTTHIRYNVFRTSSIYPGVGGVNGGGQGVVQPLAAILVYQNIFLGTQIATKEPFTGPFTIYNNTFINSNTNSLDFENGDWASGGSRRYYNNLFYASSGVSDWVFSGNVVCNSFVGDYNMYYSSGVTPTWSCGSYSNHYNWATWKSTAGHDVNGLSGTNPNFVNASGSTPADFKRTSYTENFTASPYSTRAGAYITGNEIIGFSTGTSSSIVSPLTSVKIIQIIP